jgi:hypothetical protein
MYLSPKSEGVGSRYVLAGRSWERNGYHDSDWYAPFWDREEKKVVTVEIGTTRFGAYPPADSDWPKATEEDQEGITEFLFNSEVKSYLHNEEHRIKEPYPVKKDMEVVLTKDQSNKKKVREECRKCSGTGHWVNPRNSNDKRDCFRCDGTGQAAVGKAAGWDVTEKGTVGKVLRTEVYGTFYRNGYNRPGRHNTRVAVKTAEGKVFFTQAENLELNEEVPTQAEAEAAVREHFKSISKPDVTRWAASMSAGPNVVSML